MKHITWLASYPKSGNTWVRLLLTNLRGDGDDPAAINALDTDGIASARHPFHAISGIQSSLLHEAEIDRLRPEVYRRMAQNTGRRLFIKVHDAYRVLPSGRALFPADASAGAVYIVRHPFDVVVSSAHFFDKSIEEAVAMLLDPDHVLCPSRSGLAMQFPQELSSWAGHVKSWLDQSEIDVCLLRYEDLKKDALATVTRLAAFCGLPADEDRVRRAIAHSSFESAAAQERDAGFREILRNRTFFRKGTVGEGAARLSLDQRKSLVRAFGPVMQRLGYEPTP